jgi:hypothetical protein
MPGLPDAESPDQSWMQPEPPTKLPVAGYSEFNPPPVQKITDPVAYAEAKRQMRKSLIWIVAGVMMLALSLYLFIH